MLDSNSTKGSTAPQNKHSKSDSKSTVDNKKSTDKSATPYKNKQHNVTYKGLCYIRFHYLLSVDTAEDFLRANIPQTTRILQTETLEIEDEFSFKEYRKGFCATVDLPAKTDFMEMERALSTAWRDGISNNDGKYGWMEIVPDRTHNVYKISNKHAPVTSAKTSYVQGGSMTNPSQFTQHWKLEDRKIVVDFEHDKQLMTIKQLIGPSRQNVIEVPYDSIHNIIAIQPDVSHCDMHFGLKHAPRLLERNTIITRAGTRDEEKRKVSLDGIDGKSIGKTSVLQLRILNDTKPFQSDSLFNISVGDEPKFSSAWDLIAHLKKIGFFVAYTAVCETPFNEDVSFPIFEDFEMAYAWSCLVSNGYKITDTITRATLNVVNTTDINADVFQQMASRAETVRFFEFEKELRDALKRSEEHARVNDPNDLPPGYTMMRRLVVTPLNEIFLRPEPIVKNRIIRQYKDDYFIRVIFRDEDFCRLSAALASQLDDIIESYKALMNAGFSIGERRYALLACSNSQLREHGVWFFSTYEGITADSIRSNAGELQNERCVATYVSRLGLCFSASRSAVDIPTDDGSVTFIEDTMSKRRDIYGKPTYCFTDGIGKISCSLAKKLASKLDLSRVPSAFQIRYGGCKGVVAQDPDLGDGDRVEIRQSMKKFESSSEKLEILQITKPGRLYMNRQVITLMSGLKVKEQVFLRMQENMILNMADSMIDEEKATVALSRVSVGIHFKTLKRQGFSFTTEAFFKSLLLLVCRDKLNNLSKKAWIEIPEDKGRIMMGTVDETQKLQYGEVFVSYSHFEGDKQLILERTVVCAKNPCFHPGDMRKFKAVDIPELHHMRDCIVFPQNGCRPHPDEMSGSDLDGDMYFVCWEDSLIPPGENKDPMEFPKCDKQTLHRPITVADVADFIGKYIKIDQLGVIANAHVVHADMKDIFDSDCKTLARMHSDAVDFPKSGIIPEITSSLRPTRYPDFMNKRDKPTYVSDKVLGKLYRQCLSLQRPVNYSLDVDISQSLVIDPDLKYSGYEQFLQEAYYLRDVYNDGVQQLMTLYGIRTEAEVVTGLIQSLKIKRGYLNNERFEIGEIVQAKMSVIRKRARKEFFEEFGGEEIANHSKGDHPLLLAKASACYIAGYDIENNHHMLSFPWIMSDLLSEIRNINHQSDPFDDIEVESVPLLIGRSLLKYISQSNSVRGDALDMLLGVFHNVAYRIQQYVGRKLVVHLNGLMSFGLIDVHGRFISLSVENVFNNDNELIHFLKKCFFGEKFYTERIVQIGGGENAVYVSISRFPDDGLKVRFIYEILKANPFLTNVTFFILDWACREKLLGKRRAIEKGVDFVLVVLQVLFSLQAIQKPNLPTGSIPKESLWLRPVLELSEDEIIQMSKILMAILKEFSSVIKEEKDGKHYINIHLTPQIKFQIQLRDRDCTKLKSDLLFLYTEIAKYSSVDIFYENTTHDDYLVLNLPIDIWGSLMFAEIYTARQIAQKTGAEVTIRRTAFRGVKGLYLNAYGTKEQLQEVKNEVQNLGDRSSHFITASARNVSFVNGANYCICLGMRDSNERIVLTPYRGSHNTDHGALPLHIPIIETTQQCYKPSEAMLKEIFTRQLGVTRDSFDKTVHGVLRLAITFGAYYTFYAEKLSFTVEEFNQELHEKFDIREKQLHLNVRGRGRGRGRGGRSVGFQRRPRRMRSSFMPTECNKSQVLSFLKATDFIYISTEIKYHVAYKFGSPDYGKPAEGIVVLDEDFRFVQFRLSDLKWLAVDICRGNATNGSKLKDVRVKVQSRRMVDVDTLKEMDDVKMVLDPKTRLLTKYGQQDLYVQKEFINRIQFLRQKRVEKFKYNGPLSIDSLWQDVEIKLATVNEYSNVDPDSGRFKSIRTTHELTVIPKFPGLDTSEDDMDEYLNSLWRIIHSVLDNLESSNSDIE